MANLTIALSDSQSEFIEKAMTTGNYSSPAEVVYALLDQAQLNAGTECLEKLIDEGIASGPAEKLSLNEPPAASLTYSMPPPGVAKSTSANRT